MWDFPNAALQQNPCSVFNSVYRRVVFLGLALNELQGMHSQELVPLSGPIVSFNYYYTSAG